MPGLKLATNCRSFDSAFLSLRILLKRFAQLILQLEHGYLEKDLLETKKCVS